MAKEKLEIRARKAILKIESKVHDIDNVLRDLSMKLSYVIKSKGKYYTMSAGIDYDSDFYYPAKK